MKTRQTPWVTPKMSPGAQNMRTGLDALGIAENKSERATHETGPDTYVPPKTSRGAQNMKTGPDALGTDENESGRTRSVRPKMCPGAQNMTKVPDAFGTAENDSGSPKHEKGTRRTRYHRKRVRVRNT
jgi:hypothetical protein